MIEFNGVIKKFGELGEKAGWSYVEIPHEIADKIKSGYKKSFRVKGFLDSYKIEKTSILPMGGGNFIMPINATIRKATGKRKGSTVKLVLTEDKRGIEINKMFLACLADEPAAEKFFNSLPGSHRNYFSKWIDSAKTEFIRENRIARAVSSLARNQGYAEMIRYKKQDKLL